MDQKSFGTLTKESLSKIEPKKKCCKKIFIKTMASVLDTDPCCVSLNSIFDSAKCDSCIREFLRALFIACGNVTDPAKRYHLDFSFNSDENAKTLVHVLELAGFTAKISKRKDKFIVYFKDSDTISDILAYIGATTSAFEIMNEKIVKDVRNNANRLVNCDTANIGKAISASQKYIEAIEYIKSREALSTLPSEIREAAELRYTHTQASLNELANKCQPPITKSGMKHRLEKILSYAEELKSRDGEIGT